MRTIPIPYLLLSTSHYWNYANASDSSISKFRMNSKSVENDTNMYIHADETKNVSLPLHNHEMDTESSLSSSSSEDSIIERRSIREALREKADQLREYIRLATMKESSSTDEENENTYGLSLDSHASVRSDLELVDGLEEDLNSVDDARRNFLDSEALTRVYKKLLNVIRIYDAEGDDNGTTESDNLDKVDRDSSKYVKSELNLVEYSDLNIPNRKIWIVTTASLPWMTGTSVNPLLRAAYLYRRTRRMQFELMRNETHFPVEFTDDDAAVCSQINDPLVTLVVPWLELAEDRAALFGEKYAFESQREQENYIRTWLREEAKLPDAAVGLKIMFYPARYHSSLGSIFAMGDIGALIPDEESDICILEEPEHLNWYRAPGDSWTNKFNYVVGIAHTNYKEYASGHYSGLWTAPAIGIMSSAMVRAYCHKVIKLSDVLQTFAPEKEAVSNVHGVRSEFLREGERRCVSQKRGTSFSDESLPKPDTCVYFIGKLLWAKGLDRLLDLQTFYKQCTGSYFPIDIYGDGPDRREIKHAFLGRKPFIVKKKYNDEHNPHFNPTDQGNSSDNNVSQDDNEGITLTQTARLKFSKLTEAWKTYADLYDIDLPKSRYELRKFPIPAVFPGRVDHASLTEQYKIFVNPSTSEVLCTTTAEALAMGKFVIIPVHPSNKFFMKFPNCLAYRTNLEFAANLRWALVREPEPLTPELTYELTWEAATERFIRQAKITENEAEMRIKAGTSKLDERIAWFHHQMGKGKKGDTIRKVLGGGPISEQVKYEEMKRSSLFEDGLSDEL